MINREIVYERNITGSYMKIPVGMHAGLDDRLMLRRKITGLLPVEKAYVDGNGQYWYNISGKQSLDMYCRVKEIGLSFIESLIISICSEMEILEWNLIHTSCLMLDPELIYITNSNQEFIFTVYPGGTGGIEKEFQQLMEYLLTRIDHKDSAVVRAAYRIYERSLQEGYSIVDIRNEIMEAKQQESVSKEPISPMPEPVQQVTKPKEERHKLKESEPAEKKTWLQVLKRKLIDLGILEPEIRKKEPVAPIYPEEEIYVSPEPVIRPTICLSSFEGRARGLLLYQGADQLEDIRIEGKMLRIGYGKDADFRIDRDTISQLHARIDLEDGVYSIEDLNSTNGTFVNDEPLAYRERRKLACNDIVRFADIRYRFT